MDVTKMMALARPDNLAALRLQTDDYWHKMNSKQKDYYIQGSLSAGDALAAGFHAEEKVWSIQSLSEKYGIRVRKDTRELDTEYPDFSGRWQAERRIIYLHAGIAHRLIELMQTFNRTITEEEVFRFLFLRAFFMPYAEEKGGFPSASLEPVSVRVLFTEKAFPVKMTDKAAAERFVDQVAGFPVPAGLLPFLVLIKNGQTNCQQVIDLLNGGKNHEDGHRD
ncbi:MAG: hypothetical protein ACOX00_08790 [Peptoniphilaceae bacterium]|jgi:hypothetical protein